MSEPVTYGSVRSSTLKASLSNMCYFKTNNVAFVFCKAVSILHTKHHMITRTVFIQASVIATCIIGERVHTVPSCTNLQWSFPAPSNIPMMNMLNSVGAMTLYCGRPNVVLNSRPQKSPSMHLAVLSVKKPAPHPSFNIEFGQLVEETISRRNRRHSLNL